MFSEFSSIPQLNRPLHFVRYNTDGSWHVRPSRRNTPASQQTLDLACGLCHGCPPRLDRIRRKVGPAFPFD